MHASWDTCARFVFFQVKAEMYEGKHGGCSKTTVSQDERSTPTQMTCSLAHVLTTKPRGTWKVNHNLLGDGNEMTAGL